MTLSPGTRLGAYHILALVGAGGMGEVYRARDTRLNRDVALKVLPELFAADPDRLARFKREAQLLASLNHPNIAAIYGFEECPIEAGHYGPTCALVLELVEGPTLADRIAQGPIPLDEALSIARQIADALEAAHEQGVIHRDLKPANIKVRPDGTVKVLDFGLAKALEPAGAPSGIVALNVTASPTITSPAATRFGMILGTAAYMSPEQARGRAVDTRTDIWAFGCVVYEMLTGRRPFDAGETVSDAVASILTREPDWTCLPGDTPAAVARLLRRCLQKDPARRLHHVADARLDIDDGRADSPDTRASATPPPRGRTLISALPWAVAAAAVAVAAWMVTGTRPEGESIRVVSLEVNPPPGVELYTATARSLAVSPDGTRLAFVGVLAGARHVYIRPIDQFAATPVRGSDNAVAGFFSPDGQAIALIDPGGVLKTIRLSDGTTTTVTDRVNYMYGAAWGADDRFVFVRDGALWQVPRTGGAPKALTTLGGDSRDTLHAHPTVIRNGAAVLFGASRGEQWRIEALVPATGERHTVVESGRLPLYAESGHLLFFRDGELLAAPFDAEQMQVTGPPVRMITNLPTIATGATPVDLSASGTLVYSPTTAQSTMVWVSREGAEQPLNSTLRPYTNPRLTPDGTSLLVQAGALWIQDLRRTTFTRLAEYQAALNGFAIWTPDGSRAVYKVADGLRMQSTDGSGQNHVIEGTNTFDFPGSVTSDGQTLVFMRSSEETSFDIYVLPLPGGGKPRPITRTAAYEGGVRVSPDGRWIIYVSNESGRNEIYLRAFPGPDRRWQVSTDGGTQAVWNPNGREIFYRSGNRMMVVELSTTPNVVLSPPRVLFEQRYAYGAGITIANYDVTRDGQRFVMVKDESTAGRLNVMLNWFQELQRLVPIN
jgi:Tol biopolymer transport system component